MNVQRFNFKEFGDGVIAAPRVKTFLPTGRQKEEAPPPPPPPVYNEESIRTAERDGYKKGFLEGIEEGKKQAESEQARIAEQLVQTVEKFAQSLTPLFKSYAKTVLELKQDMPKMALAIARKMTGDLMEQHARALVEQTVLQCVETMIGEPALAITVNDKLADALETKLQQCADRLPEHTHIVIQRDPELPVADCRIEWSQGGLERKTGQLWQQIEKAVEAVSATGQRDTQAQLDALNPAGRDSGSAGSNESDTTPTTPTL